MIFRDRIYPWIKSIFRKKKPDGGAEGVYAGPGSFGGETKKLYEGPDLDVENKPVEDVYAGPGYCDYETPPIDAVFPEDEEDDEPYLEEGHYRVKAVRTVASGGSSYITGRKAEAEERAAQKAKEEPKTAENVEIPKEERND